MIDDEAEYNARRQIRAQADADVAAFIASLGQDEESGVPPPVKIKISEVSTQPVEFAPFDFGHEESGTATAAGSTPAPAACPDVSEITVDFSGVSVCGCVDNAPDGDPIPDPPYNQWLWIDTYGLNTSYVLTRDPMDSTHWLLHPSAKMIDVNTWLSGSRTCPTDPFLESTVDFNLDAYCDGGIWTVIMSFGSFPGTISAPAWAFFYGTSSSPVPNTVPSCGYPPSFNTDHGYWKGAAEGGTATITF